MKLSINHLKMFAISSFAVAGLTLSAPSVRSGAATVPAGDGGATFKAKCVSCHGPDGSGNTPVGRSLKLRDLRSGEVQSQSDDALLQIISKGKGKMPAYEKSLGPSSCKELVAYVRQLGKH